MLLSFLVHVMIYVEGLQSVKIRMLKNIVCMVTEVDSEFVRVSIRTNVLVSLMFKTN